MQSAVRPRPRGQACDQEPAREDAGAPLKRHLLVLILNDHQPTGRSENIPASRQRWLNSIVADATWKKIMPTAGETHD